MASDDPLGRLMVLCRRQNWSLRKYELALRRYYSRNMRAVSLSTIRSWIRWHVKDVRWERRKERQAKHECAQRKLQQAVARGTVKKPSRCEHCQKRTIKRELQGHHRDYRYPLRASWLCPSCHVKAHGKRAMKRAALRARRKEVEKRFHKTEEKLRQRRKTGEISRRRYYKLRREALSKFWTVMAGEKA